MLRMVLRWTNISIYSLHWCTIGISKESPLKIVIYLSTNLYGSLSCDYVSKLLRNEAAQTQNPYVILIPY